MKHTATPWQINHCVPTQVCDADGDVRGCAPIAECVGKATEARANAKFIVRACNAHDALVEVAKGILVDDLLPLLPAEYVAKVRAALAKATHE